MAGAGRRRRSSLVWESYGCIVDLLGGLRWGEIRRDSGQLIPRVYPLDMV